MKNLKLMILFVIIILTACSDKIVINKNSVLTVSTFNMEWLGDGVNDRVKRNDGDYRRLAKIIDDLQSDIIACQEVENSAALEKVVRNLPDYNYYVAEGYGQQNVAVIYKKNLEMKVLGAYTPVAIDPKRNRPGLLMECKAGNFDFMMMVVHLKSTSRYDDTEEKRNGSIETRTLQAEKLNFWADSVIKNSKEKDLIVLGDFNEAPKNEKYKSLEILVNNPNIKFLTGDMKSCGKYKNSFVIDNIFVTSSAFSRFISGSENIYDISVEFTKDQLEKVSDHCPVTAQFDITAPDND